jgi:hypothetical protein
MQAGAGNQNKKKIARKCIHYISRGLVTGLKI